jgi:hypothetical protein
MVNSRHTPTLNRMLLKRLSASVALRRGLTRGPIGKTRAELKSGDAHGRPEVGDDLFRARKVRLLDVWAGQMAKPASDVLELALKPCHGWRSFLSVSRPPTAS